MRRTQAVVLALSVVIGGAMGGCGASHAADGASSSPPAPSAPADAGLPMAPAAAARTSDNVHVVLTVIPSAAKAKVLWGKRVLGLVEKHKPLVISRPRDSGPLDVVVRADGFLPVQTRLYTFADGKLSVKLTPPDEQKTLLGYREPPPPGAGADGGASLPAPGQTVSGADAGPPP